jgi:hypothetical protein
MPAGKKNNIMTASFICLLKLRNRLITYTARIYGNPRPSTLTKEIARGGIKALNDETM